MVDLIDIGLSISDAGIYPSALRQEYKNLKLTFATHSSLHAGIETFIYVAENSFVAVATSLVTYIHTPSRKSMNDRFVVTSRYVPRLCSPLQSICHLHFSKWPDARLLLGMSLPNRNMKRPNRVSQFCELSSRLRWPRYHA